MHKNDVFLVHPPMTMSGKWWVIYDICLTHHPLGDPNKMNKHISSAIQDRRWRSLQRYRTAVQDEAIVSLTYHPHNSNSQLRLRPQADVGNLNAELMRPIRPIRRKDRDAGTEMILLRHPLSIPFCSYQRTPIHIGWPPSL